MKSHQIQNQRISISNLLLLLLLQLSVYLQIHGKQQTDRLRVPQPRHTSGSVMVTDSLMLLKKKKKNCIQRFSAGIISHMRHLFVKCKGDLRFI